MGINVSKVSFAYYVPKSKKRPIAYILEDINLEIASQGEFIALVGHTGSGKSTLVQMLNALLLPTKGSVNVFGNVITAKPKIKLKPIRKRVGLVFQFPEYQIFEETVLKDIMFGPKNFGVENVEEVARSIAEIMGISHLLDKSPFNLSGGQMRKVAIAGILASNPDVLILDEPTAGLDPMAKSDLLQFLKKLNEEFKKTIIIITHDMEVVAKYISRVIVLKKGHIMYDGPKRNLFENHDLVKECNLDYPEIMRVMMQLEDKLQLHLDVHQFTIEDAYQEIIKKVGGRDE